MERIKRIKILIFPKNDVFLKTVSTLLRDCKTTHESEKVFHSEDISKVEHDILITWLDSEGQLEVIEQICGSFNAYPTIVFLTKKNEKWVRELPSDSLIVPMIIEETSPALVDQAITLMCDISEARQKAANNEILYKALVEKGERDFAAFSIDESGVPGMISEVSSSFLRKSGLKRAALFKKSLTDLMGNVDRQRFRKALIDLMSRLYIKMSLKLKLRFGMRRKAILHLHLVRKLDGFLVHCIMDFKSVVKRLNFAECNDNKDDILNAIPFPLYFKDNEGRYIGGNHKFEEIFEVQNKDIYGKTIFDILPKEIAVVASQREEKLLSNGGSEIYLGSLSEDNSSFDKDTLFVKSTFPSGDSTPRGFVSLILELGEFIEKTQKFKNNKKKYDAVFTNSPYGIVHVADDVICSVNDAFLRVLGYPNDEALKKVRFMQIVDQASHAEVGSILKELARKPGNIKTTQVNMIGGNGGLNLQKLFFHSVDLEGKTQIYIFVENL
ncbi:PAS domain-containing protein [bacterium]|nr:PAS domain-containing protein [bacterium]